MSREKQIEDKVCSGYCGVACVDGTCPQIENKRYRCEDCWLYKGCEDCCFDGTNMCEKGGK